MNFMKGKNHLDFLSICDIYCENGTLCFVHSKDSEHSLCSTSVEVRLRKALSKEALEAKTV